MKSLSRVRLLVTPWTAAHQAPPSLGFCRQEYWRGVSLPPPKHFILKIEYVVASVLMRKATCVSVCSLVPLILGLTLALREHQCTAMLTARQRLGVQSKVASCDQPPMYVPRGETSESEHQVHCPVLFPLGRKLEFPFPSVFPTHAADRRKSAHGNSSCVKSGCLK